MIDFHSHLVPGVDDGASDLEQTRAALQQMSAQGVRTVVTTPHLKGALTENPAGLADFFAQLNPRWAEVRQLAAAEFPELRVELGLEVMLDTPTPLLDDPRCRLAGTTFVLVEFPYMRIPPNCTQVLFELKLKGWRPIIAHPERYHNLSDVEEVDEWRSVGGLLQINCGSLLGKYGKTAEGLAWSMLERGWADFLSSDYHARGTLHVAQARAALEEAGGEEIAALLMEENPRRMLAGEEPESVPPLVRKRPIWRRILGR